MSKTKKEIFHEGQHVGCLMFGEGIIQEIIEPTTGSFPLVVKLNNGDIRAYTLSGRYFDKANQTLYPIELYRSIIVNIPEHLKGGAE